MLSPDFISNRSSDGEKDENIRVTSKIWRKFVCSCSYIRPAPQANRLQTENGKGRSPRNQKFFPDRCGTTATNLITFFIHS